MATAAEIERAEDAKAAAEWERAKRVAMERREAETATRDKSARDAEVTRAQDAATSKRLSLEHLTMRESIVVALFTAAGVLSFIFGLFGGVAGVMLTDPEAFVFLAKAWGFSAATYVAIFLINANGYLRKIADKVG